jgi:hypothetical protein
MTGIYGLATAKTYLEVHPTANVLIITEDSSIGGVWAEHRLYPGLKTNNMLGTYEFSDFPMDHKAYGVQEGQHLRGTVMHRYLTDYADHFNLSKKIRFDTTIETAEHKEKGGWTLKTTKGDTIATQRLVMATGMTSTPFLPTFAGQDTFSAPLFHMKDFLSHSDTLESAKNVVVCGGAKSAWDAVYAYASKGIHVDWVIRETGHGPVWMAPPYVTPLKKWLEKLVTTRLLTWFSPCIWGTNDGYSGIRNFYHRTAIGRFITNTFWGILGGDVITLNKYDSHPETKKLKPWIPAFWVASGLSILNYETDFFALVREGKVHVHIADITFLSPNTVHISTGEALHADALAVASGWKSRPPLKFLPAGIEAELGIPHVVSSESERAHIAELNKRADEEIFARFPRLKDQPVANKKLTPITETSGVVESKTEKLEELEPYRLWKLMVPPKFVESRDIAFAGALMSIQTTMVAQTQGLWIADFLGGPSKIADPLRALSPEQLEYETHLVARFGKWRYPGGYGARFPDFVFDGIPYIDGLLRDLGLKCHRKASGFKEATEPYGVDDYRGLVSEYLQAREKGALAGEEEDVETVVVSNGDAKGYDL